MLYLVRISLLLASCFHLVVGCCWQEGLGPRAVSGDAETVAGELVTHSASEPASGSRVQVEHDAQRHICLRGVPAGRVSSVEPGGCCADAWDGAVAVRAGSRATRAVFDLRCALPLTGAVRLHLLKQVVLI